MRVRVSTEHLLRASGEASEYIEAVSQGFGRIREIVLNSEDYWEGAGQEAWEGTYLSRVDMIEEALNSFRGNISALLTIAEVYEEAEEENTAQTSSLPMDVIV